MQLKPVVYCILSNYDRQSIAQYNNHPLILQVKKVITATIKLITNIIYLIICYCHDETDNVTTSYTGDNGGVL